MSDAEEKANTETTEKVSSKPATPSSPKSPRAAKSAKSAKSTTSQKSVKSAGSVKTAGSRSGSASPKSAPGSAKSTPSARKRKVRKLPKRELETETGEPPEGILPIFLASKTQELFECKTDEDVTPEFPYKLLMKEDIIQDMRARAAVSDFSPMKQMILDYPGEELLIVFDDAFKYGENFYICTTEESKAILMRPPTAEAGADGEGGGAEEEDILYEYTPPVPKDWVSQGSEFEIADEVVKDTRAKVVLRVSRLRREFGVPVKFKDRNSGQGKDSFIECEAYVDKNFDLKKTELDCGIQAISVVKDTGSQTDWKYPTNASTQYVAREYEEEKRKDVAESKPVRDFVDSSVDRFQLALQQNEIMNVFTDDWMALADEDTTFGSKADNHLKEYQSFTDLIFSRDKTITWVDWHPTVKGVVAVSCAERYSFDERIDHLSKILMTPSLILIWSFSDPIHPQILLEAPDDMYCFQFCPSNPNVIAGGCINGQVVLWDITRWADRLKSHRGTQKQKKNTMNSLPGYQDENSTETPMVRYCAVSSIEYSHRMPITDIFWVPDHMEVNKQGQVFENTSTECCQLVTAASDGYVQFWDTRPAKGYVAPQVQKEENPLSTPTTFKHIDLTWKPLMRMHLPRESGHGDYGPVRFSMSEKQGVRSAVVKPAEPPKPEKKEGGFGIRRGASAKEKVPLENVSSRYYIATEDGELVYCDWKVEKDTDSGKLTHMRPLHGSTVHFGPVRTLQRSPFYKDILLTVGGWTFTIWKEGLENALLESASCTHRLTCGHWSPTRPGVFYIARDDGNVDVWDLLDRSHEPTLSQNISAHAVTAIYPWRISNKQQLLAVADAVGTLHILEVPWSLRHPMVSEVSSVGNYFDREHKRLLYVIEHKDMRTREKKDREADIAKSQPPVASESEAEIMMKLKIEYQEYLDYEKICLTSLGLIEEKLD